MSLLNSASLVVTPNGYKAGTLYSVIPNTTLGDMAVVRATTATRVNSAGLIESVANNVPRLDYPPLGGCPSLLLEPQRTNVALNSVFVGTGSAPTNWAQPGGTGTSSLTNSTLGVGVQACSQSATAQRPFLQQNFTVSANTTFTFSMYVESISGTINYNNIMFITNPPSGATTSYFLNDVAINEVTQATAGRLSIRLVVSATTGTISMRCGVGVSSSATGSILFSRPQLEVGSSATSYIPTTTATVTRNADLISKTGISSLIGQSEGSIFVEANLNVATNERRFLTVSNGTENQRIFVWTQSNLLFTTFNGVSVVLGSLPIGTTKIAIGYTISGGSTTYSIKVNNNTLITGTAAAAPNPLTAFNLGSNTTGGLSFNGRINSAILFPTRLTNAELASLTT